MAENPNLDSILNLDMLNMAGNSNTDWFLN